MFELEKEYRRRDLHLRYGGQWQGGISTPAKYAFIFSFTGVGGEKFGYSDDWKADGSFHYTGEGQTGDMEFRAGNRAIRDHVATNKALYLFEKSGKGMVRYRGQMELDGYELVGGVPDRDGRTRTVIVFRLRSLDS